jgi:hypothetical protein
VTDIGPGKDRAAAGETLADVLEEVERSLRGAAEALARARSQLLPGPEVQAPTPIRPDPEPAAALHVEPPPTIAAPMPEQAQPATAHGQLDGAYSAFERLWERLELEHKEREQLAAAGEPERRGLEALPQFYQMTVEDREHRVNLIPLHRALQSVTDIDDFNLVSFANGVPVVAIRSDRELDMEQLRHAVAATMRRECEVLPQDSGRIYLRLVPQEEIGA